MEYKVFMSYTDIDNNFFEERYLDSLCTKINEAVQFHGGQKIGIFRNNDVQWGQTTHERISEVLQDVVFFMPVITPSFLNDDTFCEQLRQFMQREQQPGQHELILPIIFQEPRRITNPEQKRLYDEVKARNPIHWGDNLINEPFTAPAARELLGSMATRIIDTIDQMQSEDETYSPEFQRKVLQQLEDLREKLEALERAGGRSVQTETLEAYDTAMKNIKRLDYERQKMLDYLMQANRTLEAGRKARSERDNAELIFVPAALVVPGPPRKTDAERQKAERFVKAYYIDTYPVTNAQFTRFVAATSYTTVAEQRGEPNTWQHPDGPDSAIVDDHPVVCVYRADALAYAKWAGRRLPTRLEWERAMRGVAGLTWPWGNAWREGVCNLQGSITTPVHTYPDGGSPVGCRDMVGNVWEWLADEVPGGKLLLMGGSWAEPREAMPVGYKLRVAPGDGTDFDVGFRCAMDVPEMKT